MAKKVKGRSSNNSSTKTLIVAGVAIGLLLLATAKTGGTTNP